MDHFSNDEAVDYSNVHNVCVHAKLCIVSDNNIKFCTVLVTSSYLQIKVGHFLVYAL